MKSRFEGLEEKNLSEFIKKPWRPETLHWHKMAPRIMHYSQEMVDETKHLLDLLGVPWVVAKAEGEGQAAVMAAKGQLDIVATQDWDALLYRTPHLVRNLMSDNVNSMVVLFAPKQSI